MAEPRFFASTLTVTGVSSTGLESLKEKSERVKSAPDPYNLILLVSLLFSGLASQPPPELGQLVFADVRESTSATK